jgi:hypothetical protein
MGLDIVEMVVALETEFGIRLPDAALRDAETVDALFELISTHSGHVADADRQRFRTANWSRYLDVIERETGVRRKDLTGDARFVRDLGLG